jgi:hypothetical protein
MTAPLTAERYRTAFGDLLEWIRREDFRGYDPYDGCNTRFAVLRMTRATRLFLTYFNKLSPLNFRPLLGIEKRHNYCGLSLINRALLRRESPEAVRPIVERNLDIILRASLHDRYGEHCWNGNGLYIQSRVDYQTPWVPGIIGTIFCAGAVLDYCRAFGESPAHREILKSARRFLLGNLLGERNGRHYFRYKPISPWTEFTFNAAAKGAVFLAELGAFWGDRTDDAIVASVIEHVIAYQRADGAWNMSVDLDTGRQKVQIDFHQGFILDALLRYRSLGGDTPLVRQAYDKGLEFYRRQFHADGGSYYRYPRPWPSNIHDQAQGIITFAEAPNGQGLEAARRIADWTLSSMHHPAGYFFYLRYPWFTNRIPFIRWGQAWMLVALATLDSADRGGTRE